MRQFSFHCNIVSCNEYHELAPQFRALEGQMGKLCLSHIKMASYSSQTISKLIDLLPTDCAPLRFVNRKIKMKYPPILSTISINVSDSKSSRLNILSLFAHRPEHFPVKTWPMYFENNFQLPTYLFHSIASTHILHRAQWMGNGHWK